MKSALPILTLLVIASPSMASRKASIEQRPNSDEREISSVIDSLADAGMKRNVAVIDRLYSDDFFHTNADGSIMTKAQVVASYKSPTGVTVESNRHDEDRIQVHRGMAVMSCRVTLTARVDELSATRTYRVTYVLRKAHGRWQVTASHASIILH